MSKDTKMRIMYFIFLLGFVGYFTTDMPAFEERVKEAEGIRQIREEASQEQSAISKKAKRKALEKARLEEQIAQIGLPDDRTSGFRLPGYKIQTQNEDY